MQQECESNDGFCKICSETECNSRPSFQKCVLCDSSIDIDCAASPQSIQRKMCKEYDDECFSLIAERAFLRGCLNEQNLTIRGDCNQNKHKCAVCNTQSGNGCNDQKFELETCIQCNTHKEYGCRWTPQNWKGQICNDIFPSARLGCYMKEPVNP